MADDKREFLRHALATVAYRGGKAVRGTSAAFAQFEIGENPRTPAQILAHVGDLMDWAVTMAEGKQAWNDSTPLSWDDEVQRFHGTLKKFDDYLASQRPLATNAEVLLQGPVADALTHVGQLAMLRRLAGEKMRSENYARAEVVVGRLGEEQADPRREFD